MSKQQRLRNEQIVGQNEMFKYWADFAKECRKKNDDFSKQWLRDNGAN